MVNISGDREESSDTTFSTGVSLESSMVPLSGVDHSQPTGVFEQCLFGGEYDRSGIVLSSRSTTLGM